MITHGFTKPLRSLLRTNKPRTKKLHWQPTKPPTSPDLTMTRCLISFLSALTLAATGLTPSLARDNSR